MTRRTKAQTAPTAYKPWGGVTREAPAYQGGTQSVPLSSSPGLSSVDRLRAMARGMHSKRTEGCDIEQWKQPLIDGGGKLPAGYPDETNWPDNSRPPGSLQDDVAWWCAKTGRSPQDYAALDVEARDQTASVAWVMEILGAAGSVLVCIPKHAPDGSQANGAETLFGPMFDATMLITQKGRPRFASAAEPKRHCHGEIPFWVIRPRSHYLEANNMQRLYCNAKWTSTTRVQQEERQKYAYTPTPTTTKPL